MGAVVRVSTGTLEMMDRAIGNFFKGSVGAPMDAKAMLERLSQLPPLHAPLSGKKRRP